MLNQCLEIMSEGLLHACISSYNINISHACIIVCCHRSAAAIPYILQNNPKQSRNTKILAENFTTGVAYKSANR